MFKKIKKTVQVPNSPPKNKKDSEKPIELTKEMIIKQSVSRLALSKDEKIYEEGGFNYPRVRSVPKKREKKKRKSV